MENKSCISFFENNNKLLSESTRAKRDVLNACIRSLVARHVFHETFGYFSSVNRPLEIAISSVSDRSALFPCRSTMDHFSPDTVPTCPTSPSSRPRFFYHSSVTGPFSFSFSLLPPDATWRWTGCIAPSTPGANHVPWRACCPQETMRGWGGSDTLETLSSGNASLTQTTGTLRFNHSTNRYNPAKNFDEIR